MADVVTIIATKGASNANSYVTLAEADAYFTARLDCAQWTDSSNDDKRRALIMATRAVDALTFKYARETTTQSLAFPRVGAPTHERHVLYGEDDVTTIIPTDVKNAVYEQALQILTSGAGGGGGDLAELRKQGVKTQSIGDVTVQFSEGAKTIVSGPLQEEELSQGVMAILKTWIDRSWRCARG